MNIAGRFASKCVTFLFLYLYVSVSISFLPSHVYDIVIIYTVFFRHCRQNPTVSIQNHTSISLSFSLSLFLSLSPTPFLYLYLSLFPSLLFSLTRRPFCWSRLKVCYCSLHAIPALEISAITILVYKTLGQIEPIRCRRHGHHRSNNRKTTEQKKKIIIIIKKTRQ